MKRLEKIENEIKVILESNPRTRKDDMYLYYTYCINKYATSPLTFLKIFYDEQFRKEHNIPVFESVSRVRRKLQQDYEYLKPEKEVQESRINKESEYIRYAIDDKRTSKFKEFIDQED